MKELVPIVAIVFTFGLPAFIVWALVSRRYKERVELIRQGINPDSNTLTLSFPGAKALMWGLIFLAVGLAGIIHTLVMGRIGDRELFFLAIASVMVGLAMLLYYRLIADQRERAREIQEQLIASGRYGTFQRLVPEDSGQETK